MTSYTNNSFFSFYDPSKFNTVKLYIFFCLFLLCEFTFWIFPTIFWDQYFMLLENLWLLYFLNVLGEKKCADIPLLPVLKIAQEQMGQLHKVGTAQANINSIFIPVLFLITFIYKLSNILCGKKKRCHSFLCFAKLICSFLRIFKW